MDPVDGVYTPDQLGSPVAAALRPHPALNRQQHRSLPPHVALDRQQQRRWILPPAQPRRAPPQATNRPLLEENETRGRSGRSRSTSEGKEGGGEGDELQGGGARCSRRRVGRTDMRAAVGGNWLRAWEPWIDPHVHRYYIFFVCLF